MSSSRGSTSMASSSSLLVSQDGIQYQTGFGNSFESEAIPNALPRGRNNPRQVPYNLYTEQLSGTAFTAPRHANRRTWLYRIQPSVVGSHIPFTAYEGGKFFGNVLDNHDDEDHDAQHHDKDHRHRRHRHRRQLHLDPNPMRWKAMPLAKPEDKLHFITGMHTLMASGSSPLVKDGMAISMYSFTENMTDLHFYNSDGDFLLVPQQGSLEIHTELGELIVHPKEICVLPRGLVFSVHRFEEASPKIDNKSKGGEQSTDDKAKSDTDGNSHDDNNNDKNRGSNNDSLTPLRGYALEVYKGHFQLPELGPIGSNGLANARDFYHPTAWYVSSQEDYHRPCTIINKFGGRLFSRPSPHSPYNVVAWHGNYVPFKYDLTKFCAVNSVTYDHLDPSIYTVLTCAGTEPGTALADFVIFPPRIMATDDNTLRPPWFHRNTMSEFMGLIEGSYDAKSSFEPGGATLHSTMTPHGPDAISYDKAVVADCSQPTKFEGGLAFMFETSCMLKLTTYALMALHRDKEYASCWSDLPDRFTGWNLYGESSSSDDGSSSEEETMNEESKVEESNGDRNSDEIIQADIVSVDAVSTNEQVGGDEMKMMER